MGMSNSGPPTQALPPRPPREIDSGNGTQDSVNETQVFHPDSGDETQDFGSPPNSADEKGDSDATQEFLPDSGDETQDFGSPPDAGEVTKAPTDTNASTDIWSSEYRHSDYRHGDRLPRQRLGRKKPQLPLAKCPESTAYRAHVEDVREQRKQYFKHSRAQPTTLLSIDAADQTDYHLPHFWKQDTVEASVYKAKTHVVGFKFISGGVMN